MSFSTLSLISEGFDCPNMDCLFIITPIKHSGRLEQVVGWVWRPDEGKQSMVFDYTDHHIVAFGKSSNRSSENLFNHVTEF